MSTHPVSQAVFSDRPGWNMTNMGLTFDSRKANIHSGFINGAPYCEVPFERWLFYMGLVLLKTSTSTSYNRAMDVTYVYEVCTYKDEETGKKVVKRRVIGKKDSATGQIVPTNKHLSPVQKEEENQNYKELYEKALRDLQEQRAMESRTRKQLITALNRSAQKMNRFIAEALDEVEQIHQLISLLREDQEGPQQTAGQDE